ncbi:MAG: hypothetical protein A3B37_01790 [Candidatus Sungbacteria bacterium RIFCSPLOWO2_01_FULL_59_16]|uniref:VTC domain-containing protein n=1 Tax=Candidatus Sungbacteria bacterium RIFCSPLOWO2_01_FULL_59_16 TaxID=1802280 RepID=A0A1G2LCL5_9BACT|nr:MAG: hypothetical protein A3B37_01790 [Candidatus Sungbacteria bacterium RIFCSPLOWO2_01_FULL_59_16]
MSATFLLERPSASKLSVHFQRFEFKYHLSPIQASRIAGELLASHMKPDPTVEAAPERRYTVTSLYFDSPDWKCWRENESGERRRFKLRIRSYAPAPDPGTLVFLEIKRKDDAVVTKDRVALPYGVYREIFEERRDPFALLGYGAFLGEQAVRDEFLWRMARFSMRPVALIRYERLPLVGRHHERFRVTFDSGIAVNAGSALAAPDLFLPVFAGKTVMEVKFNNALPHWFHRILQRHGLQRRKFSKYYNGVAVLKHHRRYPQS